MSDALPGEELIMNGIDDLRQNRETIPALVVAIGAPRLRELGFDVPCSKYDHPEHSLYRFLARENPDSAHSKYNALINRLVSFERAVACVRK